MPGNLTRLPGLNGVYVRRSPCLAAGADRDPVNHVFTRACGFQKVDSPIDFTTTTTTANATQYVQEQITITPVVGGNVQVSNVPPAQS